MVQPDQDDSEWKYSLMACKYCIKLPLDANVVDTIIDNQIINTPQNILFHFEALNNGRKLDISTFKKEMHFHSAAPKAWRWYSCSVSMDFYLKGNSKM